MRHKSKRQISVESNQVHAENIAILFGLITRSDMMI